MLQNLSICSITRIENAVTDSLFFFSNIKKFKSCVFCRYQKVILGFRHKRYSCQKFTHGRTSIFNSIKCLRLFIYISFLGYFSLHQVASGLFQHLPLFPTPPFLSHPLPSVYHHPPFIFIANFSFPFRI